MSKAGHQLPTFRKHLFYYFGGCAVLMIIAYTLLLEYYLELGIDLRTQAFLERTALDYVEAYQSDPGAKVPVGRGLMAYRSIERVPDQIRSLFPGKRFTHGELHRRVNVDLNDDDPLIPVDTGELCIEGICAVVFIYSYEIGPDEWLYLVQGLVGSEDLYDALDFTEQAALGIAVLFAALLFLVCFFVVRSIDAPLRRLESWTSELSADKSPEQLTDLKFRELGSLAERFQSAFDRMQLSVTHEKLFLRHASHELRTPIAIVGANVELIDRLSSDNERSEALQAAFNRQYRALGEVQLLMESLLWINRQSEDIPRSEAIDVVSEVTAISDDYHYLLEGKAVSVSIEGSCDAIDQPAALVRIVLSNLIRNALQYTPEGSVHIRCEARQVSIENVSLDELALENRGLSRDDYGFGLGLELVALICGKCGWRFESNDLPSGRKTTVHF